MTMRTILAPGARRVAYLARSPIKLFEAFSGLTNSGARGAYLGPDQVLLRIASTSCHSTVQDPKL